MASSSLLTPMQVEAGVRLPDHDVRTELDEAVRRGWTEHTRRIARVVILLALDTTAGLVGIAAVLSSWALVSAGGARPVPNPVPLIAMVCCIQPLALRVTGTYGGGSSRISLERIAAGMAIAAVVGWIQAHLFGHLSPNLPNKTAYIYSAAVITIFVWAGRMLFDRSVKAGFRAGILQRRLLIIGHRADVEKVQRQIDHTGAADVHVVGALSPDCVTDNADPMCTTIHDSGAHGVLIAASLPFSSLDRIVRRCHSCGVSVSLMPWSLQNLGASYFELRETAAGPLLQVMPLRFGLPQLAIKRAMDVIVTLIGLVVAGPLFFLIALLIKLDSRGPVFFAQERVGIGGQPFRMMKFRTMHDGADEIKRELSGLNASGDQRLFKIKNDPRVTRVGRILRRLSLDELPQLLNVLKGEMSLVGPRPFFRGDLPTYEVHHFERLYVLPGITGLWQVSGRSDIVDFEEVVRLDRQYIENWSVATDLLILLKTLRATAGRGAY
jgi:exopolysaccharide biosynthesis polyprenyl glycosylphosphotransferase